MNWTNHTMFLVVGMLFASTITNSVAAEDKFPGDVTVGGTLKARTIRIGTGSGNEAVTMSKLASEMAKQLKRTTRFEVSAFVGQIITDVEKRLLGSREFVQALSRKLDADKNSSAAQITQLKSTVVELQRQQITTAREIATLKRDIVEIRRELSKKTVNH